MALANSIILLQKAFIQDGAAEPGENRQQVQCSVMLDGLDVFLEMLRMAESQVWQN